MSESELFEGHANRYCGEHRSTGTRAWCSDCSEWCYSINGCNGCARPQLETEYSALLEQASQLLAELDSWKRGVTIALDDTVAYDYGERLLTLEEAKERIAALRTKKLHSVEFVRKLAFEQAVGALRILGHHAAADALYEQRLMSEDETMGAS